MSTKTIMIKNVYWRTNFYFLIITDGTNRSWCMGIDQINCSQGQLVMQSSIQCRTFEFLKAVEKKHVQIAISWKILQRQTRIVASFYLYPSSSKSFSQYVFVFFDTCFKRSIDLETDSWHVVRYICRPIEMCFPRSLIRQSNWITTKWCLMHWDPELPR